MKPVWLLLISAISASLGRVLFKKGSFDDRGGNPQNFNLKRVDQIGI